MYSLTLLDYTLECDTFIKRLSVVVIYGNNVEDSGAFKYNENFITLSNDKKLINFSFKINIHGDKFDYVSFSNTLSHEIHHAYKYRQLLLNHDNKFPEKEKIKANHYKSNNDYKNENRSTNDYLKDLRNTVHSILYYSDKDEISANGTMMYDYLMKHQEITQENIQEHINELPISKEYIKLTYLYNNYDKYLDLKSKEIYHEIGEIHRKVYNSKISDNAAVILTKQKISKSLSFMLKNYKRIAKYAFEKRDKECGMYENLEHNKGIVELNMLFEKSEIMEKLLNKSFIKIL